MNRNIGGYLHSATGLQQKKKKKGGGEYPQVYVNETAAVFLCNHVSRHKGQKRGIWSPPAEIKVC